MDKYGMIESVDEVEKGKASSLMPSEDIGKGKSGAESSTSPLSLQVNPPMGTATSLSPNEDGGFEVVGANEKPAPNNSPALENLKRAVLGGAAQAMKNNRNGGVQDTNKNTMGANPMVSAGEKMLETTTKQGQPIGMSMPQAETAPMPKVEAMSKGGIQGWNLDGVLVELPRGIDPKDQVAMSNALAFEKQMMAWTNNNDDEEDII